MAVACSRPVCPYSSTLRMRHQSKMKKTIVASTAIFALGLLIISQLSAGEPVVGEWSAQPANQELSAPAPLRAPALNPPNPPQEVPSPVQQVQDASPSDIAPGTPPQSVLQTAPPNAFVPGPVVAEAPCGCCCCTPCCCPVPTTICLVEPCGCASHEICVNVPPCCVGEAPQVRWRNGILGRKIAHLCWPCCGKRVKVIIRVLCGPRVIELN